MGKAPTPLPHTMMNLVKAGGFDTSDAACKKALAKVGLKPDQFGTYNSVNESQADTRKELQRRARNEKPGRKAPKKPKHVSPCAGGKGNCVCHSSPEARKKSSGEEFWHANSQAGHLSQDAINREPGKGKRGDPCENYPPGGSGKGAHGGTYGYDVNRAPCMDHAGTSTMKGSPHYMVCRCEDDFAAQTLGKPVTQNDMKEGVARSAAAAVTGSAWETAPNGKDLKRIDPSDAAAKKVQSQFRKDQIAQASGGSGAAAGAGAGKATPSTQKSLTKDQKHAIACIVAQWEKGVAAMQQDSINKYGPGSKKGKENALKAWNKENSPKKKSWDDLTDKQKNDAVAARQRELQKQGINKNPFSAKGDIDTKNACREYQANWLWQQSGGSKGKDPRSFPPMQGFGGSIHDGSGGSSGGGKKTGTK